MFFIIDVIPGMKILKVLQGTCRSCGQIGSLELIKTYQCLRLFFIPIFKWHTEYFIRHSCGAMMAVTEDDAIAMMYAGVIPDSIQMDVVRTGSKKCRACGRALEDDFICCPYCGSKR